MKELAISKRRIRKNDLHFIYFVVLIFIFFVGISSEMGFGNMISTLLSTAYRLLIDTVLYIMAISVLAGALGKLFTEFGVVNFLNKILSPLIRPIYGLPGVASIGIITTYLSDNPAIISLAKDKKYLSYFKKREIACLCNLGTSFGMGLIVTTFMISLGFLTEAIIGNVGAIIGSVISVRLMQKQTKNYFRTQELDEVETKKTYQFDTDQSDESFLERFMTAFLEGGKFGVDVGLSIIPGVLFICTIVIILTFGPVDVQMGYQGLPYEGIGFLPLIASKLDFVLKPLFGFSSHEAIAFPVTALGSVGASMSLVTKFLDKGIIGGNEIAIFTAMGMCYSGFLSTHVAMLDALSFRKLIKKAITSHLVGGFLAGVFAHLLYMLYEYIV